MNLMVLDSAALIMLILVAVMPKATLSESSTGCSTYFQLPRSVGLCKNQSDEYRGYDDVPELMVSSTSCELTSGQLSIKLTNIDLANYSEYQDVIVDIFCVDLSSNVSSCRNCLSDEQPQLSYGQCNECIINQSLYAINLEYAATIWPLEPFNLSLNVSSDPISSVQCYLQGCGALSLCALYKFKALPIICQDITTTTTNPSVTDYSIISSLFSMTQSVNDITTSTTTTTTPELLQASTLLTSVTSVIHYNSSEGQYTVDDSIVFSPSIPYSTVIINTTLMSPTTFPTRVSSTSSSHSNSKSSMITDQTSLSSQFSLVIVAISLVCLIAIIVLVLIGFLFIYKSWTNKLESYRNKTVEDEQSSCKDLRNDSVHHIIAINTRPHAIDEHTTHTQLNIDHSKLDICSGDGSSVWDGSQEEADTRDRA